MSRIGKKPIDIPAGVEISVDGSIVTVKGPKGTLTQSFNAHMSYETNGNEFIVKRPDDSKESKMIHGTTRALIQNMVTGVSKGFSKTLVIIGIGYAASMQGNKLVLRIGYANPITIEPMEGVTITCKDANNVIVSGIDAQKVGQQAAIIRQVRKPEPYHGKGIRYEDEHVELRVSKAKKKESATK